MNILLNPDRVRRIIADCDTEADIQAALRLHKIRFSWCTTEGGTAIRIPCRKGSILITRSRPYSRSAAVPVPAHFYPPVYHS